MHCSKVSSFITFFAKTMIEVFIPIILFNRGFSIKEILTYMSFQYFFAIIITYLVPKIDSTDSYDEYMFVNGQLERLGDWGVDLSGYATISQLQAVDNKFANYLPKNEFQTTVGDLTKLTNYTTGNTLVDEINLINERLIWQEIASI